MRRFAGREVRLVCRALGVAEDLTARFYCIPGREWPRFPYEVRTRAAGTGPEPGALADVVRVRVDGRRAFPERFRIRLGDEAILGAAERHRTDDVELYPLLLYVLAHELVHVVRFGEGRARWDATCRERAEEERRVHAITGRVLRPAAASGVDPVLDLYGRYLDDIEPGGDSPK